MKLLVVDDDSFNREYLAGFLTRLGHEVNQAGNGSQALEYFLKGSYDLVLSDIRMPHMSGLDFLKRIRSCPQGQDSLVILFTAYSELASAVEALRAGAYDYLLKPVNIKELVAVLEKVEEHLALRRENRVLTHSFEDAVKTASEDTRKELIHFKKAYYQSLGLKHIGVFSRSMQEVFEQARLLQTERSIPVLIEGETGTGKEVVARFIHFGPGSTAPFIDVNCAALSSALFESELFGYEAGAFSGGQPRGQKGKLDLAQGGTVFLDEIAEIAPPFQAKLLRVLQENEYYRVGGLKKIKSDIRFIGATNACLKQAVAEGSFRADLYYRMSTGHIYIPPLRERREEILPLATMFLQQFAQQRKKAFNTISPEAASLLMAHSWPGNVRELRNMIERAVILDDNSVLKPEHLPLLLDATPDSSRSINILDWRNLALPPDGLPLEELNREIIRQSLAMHQGNITRAAAYLGLTRRTLSYRLNKMQD